MKGTRAHCGVTRRDFVASGAVLFAGTRLAAPGLLAAEQAPASVGPASPQLIEDLVAANRILAAEGVLDAYGHVSARHDRDPNRYLLSRSLAPELVTAADIMEFDLDSRPVDARGRSLYTERFIHGEIYKVRPEVKVVIHNHAPELIPFGITAGVPLRPACHQAAFVAQGVPVFEIRKAGGMTDMLVRSAELGRALAQSLANHPAALMRGHGAVVVGASLPRAVGRSIYLQLNARVQRQAMALGGSITYLDPEEASKREADEDGRDYGRAWELWKRKALGK
jgi:ribulose-5-phosphate 4-epimerase/fuculose-1-phosphate aldolase